MSGSPLDRLPHESVRAWMKPPSALVHPSDEVKVALRTMRAAHVRRLLVMDDDELCGVVTDRDLQRPDWGEDRPMALGELYQIGQDLRVRDVMTEEVITVAEDEPIARAAQRMVDHGIGCLPVVRDGAVVGLVTRARLLAALVHAVAADR